MLLSSWLPLVTTGVAATLLGLGVEARQIRKQDLHARQIEAARRFHRPAKRAASAGPQNITFSNPKASRESEWFFFFHRFLISSTEFYVDGKSIPEVGWDVGPSWAGLLPISNKTKETREVRFIIICEYGLHGNQCYFSYSFGSSLPAQKAVLMT